jgi:diguanylate cyclase (GGDEF)-like protein
MEDAMRENTMIIKRTALPKIRDAKTPAAPSLDIQERDEETINSLLLFLKKMGRGAILLADDDTNRLAEVITRLEERTFELMEANRKLYELSITDGLTGLFNHRYFLGKLEAEYRRAIRYRRSLALILLDIDHFKEVNDTYGHPCGDLVLKNLAGLLKSCLRSSDVAARCGGDELAIILPETNKSKASEVAEKLRRQLRRNPFAWNGDSFGITCSIGVAAVPDMGIDNWNALLESADKSLYRAKRQGRNRVTAINSNRRQSVPKGGPCRRQQAFPIH